MLYLSPDKFCWFFLWNMPQIKIKVKVTLGALRHFKRGAIGTLTVFYGGLLKTNSFEATLGGITCEITENRRLGGR